MLISQSAFDLIVREEVSSKAYYERHYTRPEWPKGASGVTIGIGYDLGYNSVAKIKADWGPHVTPEMLTVMCTCSGVKGDDAKALLPKVKNKINIPWAAAIAVFADRDIPNWYAQCKKALPNYELLGATCKGTELSLAYNRGAGIFTNTGDRYREGRAIRTLMSSKEFSLIPAQFRSMKRLWVGTSVAGVAGRRDREAALFEVGLKEMKEIAEASAAKVITDPIEIPAAQVKADAPETPDPAVIESSRPDERARTKPPATSNSQNATTGTIVASSVPAAAEAKKAGMSTLNVVLVTVAIIALAGGIFYLWYRNRNPSGDALA